jgi:putative ATP-dependent endonuclease of OLD family
MGGGIEQLLMVAVVLQTTSKEGAIFLEEPESHLHPGAQRYLIDQLIQDGRQVFITTHSPTFLNQSVVSKLFQVTQTNGRTSIRSVEDSQGLNEVIVDIGVQNSDVLLSDAVMFVEGVSDKAVFSSFARLLGRDFIKKNISILTTDGGEFAERTASIRSKLLAELSLKMPVPHLFIFDKDEKELPELTKIRAKLKDKAIFLKHRELENYLLNSTAINKVLSVKCSENSQHAKNTSDLSAEFIDQLIKEKVNASYNLTLLKKLRKRMGGLKGGFISHEEVPILERYILNPEFPKLLQRKIQKKLENTTVVSTLRKYLLMKR